MTSIHDVKLIGEEYAEGPHASQVEDVAQKVEVYHNGGGMIWASGLGKSALVAQKFVGTARCLGLRAVYLHPVEAFHGDAGALCARDVLIAVSASGNTHELLELVSHARASGVITVSMCGVVNSSLEQLCEHNVRTAPPHLDPDHIPVASFISAIIGVDMLAVALAGAEAQMYHPGGSIGESLIS